MEKPVEIEDKKKILIRVGSLRHGGAEKVLVTFLKNIPENKYEIDLLLNLRSGKYLSEVPQWIKIFHLNTGEMITTNRPWEIPEKVYRNIYQGILKLFPKLLYKYILKDKKYDVELIANHRLLDEVLKSPINSKKIVWVHNDLFSIPEYTQEKLRNFFQADKIMVISDKIKQGFEKLAQTPKEKQKLIRIYNPIDSHEIIEKSEEKINFDFYGFEKEKTFVAVGTVFPQKGFDRLIEMHKKLLEEGLKHKILIVGDGYDFTNVKNLCENLKVEDTVKMVGFQANPYPFFRHADFFILSSRYEGYPTVLFEALTLKKPIVATDVSGVKEILQNGKLGMIVENSKKGIYQGMKEFLTNPDTSHTYIEKMDKEELPFSLENAVNLLTEIIDSL